MIQQKSNEKQRNLTRRELLQSTVTIGLSLMIPRVWALPEGDYFPQGNQWEIVAPKDAGIDAALLDAAAQYAGEHNSSGLVVLRGGRIVLERYWVGWTQEYTQPIYSASKSILSTLIGMAIEEHKLRGIEQRAADFVPAWKGTPKDAITLRHMLTMISGIKAIVGITGGNSIASDIDIFGETAALPLVHKPGEVWEYNTPVYRMLIRI